MSVIYEERKLAGNTLEKLIARHRLDVTHPTLSRMLKHYDSFVALEPGTPLRAQVHASLFPEWLKLSCGKVVSQPYEWYYTGAFPFGEWKRRTT